MKPVVTTLNIKYKNKRLSYIKKTSNHSLSLSKTKEKTLSIYLRRGKPQLHKLWNPSTNQFELHQVKKPFKEIEVVDLTQEVEVVDLTQGYFEDQIHQIVHWVKDKTEQTK